MFLLIWPGNIFKLIDIVKMLIEWLWKYEYFVNLRKMAWSTTNFSKNYLIDGPNIISFGHYWQVDFYQLPSPHQRLPDFF